MEGSLEAACGRRPEGSLEVELKNSRKFVAELIAAEKLKRTRGINANVKLLMAMYAEKLHPELLSLDCS